METSGAHRSRGFVSVLVLVVACGSTEQTASLEPGTASNAADASADAGPDAGSCPKPDGGRIQVTRRGCPTTLDIGIR
jgi:hypothetical protein